jgi:hypothetical protein
MMADLTVNVYTNMRFMRNKVTCEERYRRDLDVELSVLSQNPDVEPMVEARDKGMFVIEEEQHGKV